MKRGRKQKRKFGLLLNKVNDVECFAKQSQNVGHQVSLEGFSCRVSKAAGTIHTETDCFASEKCEGKLYVSLYDFFFFAG